MADGYYATNYWAAFAFRKTNYSDWYGTSGYMVYYRYNGWIYLYRAGYGNLASGNTGKNLSAWRHVKVVVSGSNIKVYVDGNLEINHTDGTYTNDYFGFNVFGVAARYDNLMIKNSTEVYYVRDVNGDVLAEYDVAGNLLAEYVYGNGQRLAKLDPNTTVDYYLNDHLGSARAMYGSGWSANYYPFGEVASQTGSDEDTHFDFTGQERDHGTGLIYFPRRYYDPEIGRWLSVDPLADQYPWSSPYVYVNNNPLNLIDPNGEEWYRVAYEEEEEYEEDGETKTRTVTKYQWEWHEDTTEMEVWTGQYYSEGNKVMETMQGQNVAFDVVDGIEYLLGPDGSIAPASDVIKIGMMPLGPGGLSMRLIGARGMTNAWNYFQYMQKIGKISKDVTYTAWKASSGFQKWQRLSQAWHATAKGLNMPYSFMLGMEGRGPVPSGVLNRAAYGLGLFVGKIWSP